MMRASTAKEASTVTRASTAKEASTVTRASTAKEASTVTRASTAKEAQARCSIDGSRPLLQSQTDGATSKSD